MPSPTLEEIELRREIRRRLQMDDRIAILGDNNSPSRVRVPGRSDHVYVRYPASDNNTAGLGWPTIAKMVVDISDTPGKPVIVGWDNEGDWAVKTVSTKGLIVSGESAGAGTQSNQINQWADLNQSPYLRSQPLGAGAPLYVSVLNLKYIDSDRLYHDFNGEAVDLESYLPTNPNEWLLAGLFLKQSDDTVEVVTSTAQNFSEPLTAEDMQECIDGSTDLSIFIAGWILRYEQTVIAETDKLIDFRQWVNVPQAGSTVDFLLEYHPSADIASSVSLTATTWTDLCSNQNFTVADATDTIEIAVSGAAYIGTTAALVSARINIDSAGTPITRVISGSYVPSGGNTNALAGAGVIKVTGLSAAVHTIKVQVWSENTNTLNCQPTTRPNTDSLTILVKEYGS